MEIATISLAIALLVALILWQIERNKLHKTIDSLLDRVMARDYKEYMALGKPVETVEPPKREPLSWYDDPEIEDD